MNLPLLYMRLTEVQHILPPTLISFCLKIKSLSFMEITWFLPYSIEFCTTRGVLIFINKFVLVLLESPGPWFTICPHLHRLAPRNDGEFQFLKFRRKGKKVHRGVSLGNRRRWQSQNTFLINSKPLKGRGILWKLRTYVRFLDILWKTTIYSFTHLYLLDQIDFQVVLHKICSPRIFELSNFKRKISRKPIVILYLIISSHPVRPFIFQGSKVWIFRRCFSNKNLIFYVLNPIRSVKHLL